MQKRYKQIDLLRGMAILLVLLGHSVILYPIDLHSIGWCSFLFSWLSSVHMSLFFMISGFCYCLTSARKGGIGNMKQYKEYILKKVRRLMIPYIIFCVCAVMAKYMFPSAVNHKASAETITDVVLRGGQLWFIYTLFLVFLIFPALEKLYLRAPAVFVVLNAMLLLFYLGDIFLAKTDILTLSSICRYLPYFSAGYMICDNFSRIKTQWGTIQKKLPWYIVLAIWIGCISAVHFDILPFKRLLYFIASLAGIYCLTVLAPSMSSYKCSFLECCSEYSLQLYLFNGYTLVISRTAIVSLMHCSNAILIILFNMLVDCLLTLAIIKYIVSRVNIFRVITGIVEH